MTSLKMFNGSCPGSMTSWPLDRRLASPCILGFHSRLARSVDSKLYPMSFVEFLYA